MGDDLDADELSDAQKEEFQRHFNTFDYRKEGAILTADLGTVLRACGQVPTESWLKERVKAVDPDGKGIVEWEAFVRLLKQSMAAGNVDDELLEAFRRFDKLGTGQITSSELRTVLTTLGDALTEEEAEELITDADVMGTGVINYESLCRTLVYGPD